MIEAADPVVSASPWTPAMVTALFAGMAFMIGALGKVLVDLKTAKSKAVEAADLAVVAVNAADEVKRNVETSRKAGEEAGNARDHKLDEIKMLVDGKFSDVLDRVARLTRAIAHQTGNPSDIQAADEAQDAADKQRAKVNEAAAQRSTVDERSK